MAPETGEGVEALVAGEAAASEEEGIFHPHAPRPSVSADAEPPQRPQDYETAGLDAVDEKERDKLVADEAETSENAGIFHPHAPRPSVSAEAEPPPRPQEYETAGLDAVAEKERELLVDDEAKAAEEQGIFHPHAPRPSIAAAQEPPPRPQDYEAGGVSAEERKSRELLLVEEAKAAEEEGIFHPHAPGESTRANAEPPPRPQDYETAGVDAADEKDREQLLAEEAKAAEEEGIFHPHAPRPSVGTDAEPPPRPQDYETSGVSAADEAQRDELVKAEASAAENAGIFHPHAPARSADDAAAGAPAVALGAAPAATPGVAGSASANKYVCPPEGQAEPAKPPPPAAPPTKTRACIIL